MKCPSLLFISHTLGSPRRCLKGNKRCSASSSESLPRALLHGGLAFLSPALFISVFLCLFVYLPTGISIETSTRQEARVSQHCWMNCCPPLGKDTEGGRTLKETLFFFLCTSLLDSFYSQLSLSRASLPLPKQMGRLSVCTMLLISHTNEIPLHLNT